MGGDWWVGSHPHDWTLQGVGEHPVDISSAKSRHPSGDTWACRSVRDSTSMSERRLQRGLLPHDSPQRKASRRQRSLSDAQVRGEAAEWAGISTVCTISPSALPGEQPHGSPVGGELSSVLLCLESSDWSERYAAVAELGELIQHSPAAVSMAVVKVCGGPLSTCVTLECVVISRVLLCGCVLSCCASVSSPACADL